jgi:hypothetical protein
MQQAAPPRRQYVRCPLLQWLRGWPPLQWLRGWPLQVPLLGPAQWAWRRALWPAGSGSAAARAAAAQQADAPAAAAAPAAPLHVEPIAWLTVQILARWSSPSLRGSCHGIR